MKINSQGKSTVCRLSPLSILAGELFRNHPPSMMEVGVMNKFLEMKKILYLLIVTLIIACNKDIKINTSSALNKSSDSDLHLRSIESNYFSTEEINGILNTAAISLLGYLGNSEFTKEVFLKAQKKCGGDYEVLFKYLNEELIPDFRQNIDQNINLNKTKIEVSSNFSNNYNGLESRYLQSSLVYDEIINGVQKNVKYFTQIYIPYIEKFNENTLPVAIAVASSENDILFGYEISRNGEFQIIDISENYAKENLVWVVSFNEMIFNENDLSSYFDCIRDETIDDQDGDIFIENPEIDPRSLTCNRYFFSKIFLKESLESWYQGKSDVSFIFTVMDIDGWKKVLTARYPMTRVSRGDLNKWIELDFDNHKREMTAIGARICENEILDFILFENDIPKHSWQREYKPWLGDCDIYGNDTYYYSSKENSFFHRTYNSCGIHYGELPPCGFSEVIHKNWMYNGYSGFCTTTTSKTDN